MPPMVFRDGEFVKETPLAGEDDYWFTPPAGLLRCHLSLHCEVATLPVTFKAKGIREHRSTNQPSCPVGPWPVASANPQTNLVTRSVSDPLQPQTRESIGLPGRFVTRRQHKPTNRPVYPVENRQAEIQYNSRPMSVSSGQTGQAAVAPVDRWDHTAPAPRWCHPVLQDG